MGLYNIIQEREGYKSFNKRNDYEVKELLKIYFKNVSILLKAKGISNVQMKREIEERYGFVVSSSSVSRFVSGQFSNAKLSYLNVFAVYVGVPLVQLLSEDFTTIQEVDFNWTKGNLVNTDYQYSIRKNQR